MGKGYKDYVKMITSFNTDKDVIALREIYERPSFFEILSKQKSETTYSAFLKWLFQLNVGDSLLSPILLLLEIIINNLISEDNKADKVTNQTYNRDLFNHILSGKLKISNIKVETEKYVSELAKQILREKEEKNNSNISDISNSELEDRRLSKDKIDIFIECDIIGGYKNFQKLQIIIENKIKSQEGKDQTLRYFNGCQRNDILQFYIFLKPDFNTLKAKNSNFVNLSYQEILDGIVLPLLRSSKITERDHFFLEEFKNELMYPNIDSEKDLSVIAISDEIAKEITSIWEKHKDLLIDILLLKLKGEKIWKIGEEYVDKEPINKTEQEITFLNENSSEYNLLESYSNENWNFINAFVNSISKDEFKNIEVLIKNSSNQRSKSTVYFDGKLIGENLSNYKTVIKVVEKWIETNSSIINSDQDSLLTLLNKIFPKSINPYYKNGNLLPNLFFEFNADNQYPLKEKDKERARKIIAHELSNAKSVYNSKGINIVLAKTWRKDALRSLINHLSFASSTN